MEIMVTAEQLVRDGTKLIALKGAEKRTGGSLCHRHQCATGGGNDVYPAGVRNYTASEVTLAT